MSRRYHVFVVGPDPVNMSMLRRLFPDTQFHELLPLDRLKDARTIDFSALVAEAERRLEDSPVRPDAIIGYWDFPASSLVPLLCERRGLPSASLRAALACEHKYWSRIAQQNAGCAVPRFFGVDPYRGDPGSEIPLSAPYWLKPVKSYGSQLAFLIREPGDIPLAIDQTRRRLGRLARPFQTALDLVDIPPKIREIGAHACIAEEHVRGRQCTLEGYAYGGEIVSYAVVDSLKDDGGLSFGRYQYPSSLPMSVRRRMGETAEAALRHIGYDTAPFNIEFFYDESRDRLTILEINPRLSQSHATLFEMVDGAPHLSVLVDLALGRRPCHPRGAGEHACAARFFLRAYDDGVVTRVPSPALLRELERRHPGARVSIRAALGERLSHRANRESYSYELGTVDVGGRDDKELKRRFAAISRELSLAVDPLRQKPARSRPSDLVRELPPPSFEELGPSQRILSS